LKQRQKLKVLRKAEYPVRYRWITGKIKVILLTHRKFKMGRENHGKDFLNRWTNGKPSRVNDALSA
jgi:hypothetical protein